jgi:hypothetical protein
MNFGPQGGTDVIHKYYIFKDSELLGSGMDWLILNIQTLGKAQRLTFYVASTPLDLCNPYKSACPFSYLESPTFMYKGSLGLIILLLLCRFLV